MAKPFITSQHGDIPGIQTSITDPGDAGAIPVDKGSGTCALVSVGADTRTLAIPSFLGQRLTLTHKTDGGSVAVTVASRINYIGNTIITLTDANDSITLRAIHTGSALRWQVAWDDLKGADNGASSDLGASLS